MGAVPIEKCMFSFEKRQEMRKHPMYDKIKEPWENGLYLTSQQTGNLEYLIKEAHVKLKKDRLTRADWGKFYLDSGKERIRKIGEESNPDFYKLNKYYGRTLNDLGEMSKIFFKDCNENYGLNISLRAALNIVYMKIVDDTFLNYQRIINTVLNLKSQLPNYTFEFTDGLTFDNSAVDIFVYKENELIGAFQILSDSEKNINVKNTKIKSETEQKHEFCEAIYGVKPEKIYSSYTGFMKNSIPSLS